MTTQSFLLLNFTLILLNWAEYGVSLLDSVQDDVTVRPRVLYDSHSQPAERLTIFLHDSLILDLQLSRDLISDQFYVRHHLNGKEDIWQPEDSSDHPSLLQCHYRGVVRNVSNSWTTLSTCSGLSGAVFDGLQLYYIEAMNGTLDGDHSWTKHSKLNNSNNSFHCHEDDHRPIIPQSTKRVKRMSGQKEVVKLVLVVDYAIYKRHQGDMRKIIKRVLDIANLIKEIYLQLGVSIVLVGVIVWSEGDRIVLRRHDSSGTLSNFRHYRHTHMGIKTHDNAHLITGVQRGFFGSPVGKAYVDTMCKGHDSCGFVMDDVDNSAAMTASFIAHEMGHNFGMSHDEANCHCLHEHYCVMTPVMGGIPTAQWSSCSQELIRNQRIKGKYDCLRNNSPNSCGNMVLDPGEECDCGMPFYCSNPCCNPKTCKFIQRIPKVECTDGDCCNLQTCLLESAGVECRPAEYECDLPEYCDGHSKVCPADLFKHNGTDCKSQRVTRERHICIDKQCKRIPQQWTESSRTKLISNPSIPTCLINCTKNGVCNNRGKCHCFHGFDPASNCQHVGSGGSVDGGPSLDPKVVMYNHIELYILFLAIFPVIAFLFLFFYYFLDEEQKNYFCFCIRNPRRWCQEELPVHKPAEKRDFKDWMKNRVRLTLPIPTISGGSPLVSPLTPMSGFSTATTLSVVNTPDTAATGTSLPPPINDKKLLLTPPIQRLAPGRPAPPPPTPPKPRKNLFAVSNEAMETKDEVTSSMPSSISSRPFNPPPAPPSSSAKPRLV